MKQKMSETKIKNYINSQLILQINRVQDKIWLFRSKQMRPSNQNTITRSHLT